MGYKGDPNFESDFTERPPWTKDGSLLVFLKLQQYVPEFEEFVNDAGQNWRQFIPKESESQTLTDEEGAALFGAQMVGRWTSVSNSSNRPWCAASLEISQPDVLISAIRVRHYRTIRLKMTPLAKWVQTRPGTTTSTITSKEIPGHRTFVARLPRISARRLPVNLTHALQRST